MSDDYLWDRSGPPDPEIARLEELLRPLGQQASATPPKALLPSMGLRPDKTGPTHAWGATRVWLAAAAGVALAIGGWWTLGRTAALGWHVTMLDGDPSVSRRVTGTRDLAVGDWLETGSGEKAFLEVADIGSVNLEPGTRVRLVATSAGEHRLELLRGTLHATIIAPPRQFFVHTPSATVVDLGCAYTLTVDEGGAGLLTVSLGWVALNLGGRESLVPAGFVVATRPGAGPGTPYHIDQSPAVRAALDLLDRTPASAGAGAALDVVLAASTERDEATLWHLLSRVAAGDRDRVFDHLTRFVPPPPGVTRDGIRGGRRDMLDQWWDALGLGTIAWWRNWTVQGSER